ncbi:MAG: AAA family ATPase [Nitrospinae bacterium]|nr:AAA family ATPase [Nitrospinota bacterium]
MHKVKKIKIEGFRRLHDIEIEMRPLMVMIGANGVGKTSFLDAMSLLSASAEGTMNRKLNDMGGIAEVLTRGRAGNLALETEIMEKSSKQPLKYSLHIEPKGVTYNISPEVLSQERGRQRPFKYIESNSDNIFYFSPEKNKLVRPTWEHNPFESTLSQVSNMFPEAEELRRVLSSVTQYHVLDVSQRAPVKLPQQMKPADLPGENGEDMVPFLYSLREKDPDRYEAIEDTLKSAFPGFESLNFPPVAAGMLSMTWKEKNFKNPIYINQLSEGTLRFLWLISLLQSPALSPVTMIDEPEVSLHPEMLSFLADLMRETSERTQIIVATHSDRLVRFLDPKEVVVMDIGDDGFASAKWADSLDLEQWFKEYTLDEAWRMGRMGGRS